MESERETFTLYVMVKSELNAEALSCLGRGVVGLVRCGLFYLLVEVCFIIMEVELVRQKRCHRVGMVTTAGKYLTVGKCKELFYQSGVCRFLRIQFQGRGRGLLPFKIFFWNRCTVACNPQNARILNNFCMNKFC